MIASVRAFEERSERYKRNAQRFERAVGVAIAAVFVLVFVALVVAGAVALISRLF